MRKLILFTTLIFCSAIIYAQTAGDYQSNGTGGGNWNVNTTWEVYNGSTWSTPSSGTYPDENDGVITIQPDDIVTIPNGSTITADEIYVDLYGTLEIASGGTLDLQDGTGNDLIIYNDFFDIAFFDVYGRFEISNGATAVEDDLGSPGPLTDFTTTYYNGSVVELKYTATAGEVPGGSWETGSTIEITGYTSNSVAPAGLNQTFYNFTWNCPSQSRSIDLDGALTDIEGNLTVSATGGNRSFALTRSTGPYVCNIDGDLIIDGDANFIGNNTAAATFNIGGDLLFSSTNTRTSFFGNGGDPTLNITGDLSITNGVLAIPSRNANGTINLEGDFILTTPGTLTTGNAQADFNFTGSSTQTVTTTGSNNGEFDYYILNGSTVDLGTGYLSGDGTFNLNTGGKILVGSTTANGAIQSGTTLGNIRVDGTRTFSAGSTIEYNGTAAQKLGNGYPVTDAVNLIINNSNGVTLNVSPTINAAATLSLLTGNLALDAYTLTINGVKTGTGNFVGGATSNMVVGGSGDLGTISFVNQLSLASLNLNRTGASGGFSLGSNLNIGTFTQTSGTINLNGFALSLTGNYSRTAGNINSNATSSLSITDSGTLPSSLPLTGGIINTLTMDRTGSTLNLPSTITITNLNLLGGTVNNTGSLTMASGGTVTRLNGSMTSSPINSTAGNSYNILYNPGSDITAGPEFSTNINAVNNVTKNGLGTLTLANNYTVNGNLIFSDGTFSIGTTDLTLNGNLTSNSTSSFTNGLLILDGTSVISGTTILSLGNLQINSTAAATFPSSNINIGGNIQFFGGATFNANNGTITLNGSATQQIAAGGSTFNNITVFKSGGDVTLTNPLNLAGSLDFNTGTTFNSSGNLTLLSTSDGTTGNARIGRLPSGAVVNGNVTIQRYMSGEGQNVWRHISSFTSNATINGLLDDFPLLQPMYYYDETVPGSLNLGWVPVSAPSTPLNVGTGYIAAIFEKTNPTVWDLTGPVNQGTINYTVTYSGPTADDGWNHLGNPYPSTVNWDVIGGWTKTNISNTIYVRDFSAGIYRTWNGSVGTLGNGNIASGQGFFVVSIGSSPGLSINEIAKVTSTGAFYREQEEELTNLLVVKLSNGKRNDFTYIKFQEDAIAEFDPLYDGYKLNNNSVNLATTLESGRRMCINYLPNPVEETEVKLDIYTVGNGTHTLHFEELESFQSAYEIFLVDSYNSTEVNLREIDSLTFEVNELDSLSFGPDRFKIVFQNSVTGLDLFTAENGLLIYPNPADDIISIELNSPDLVNSEKVQVQIYEISNNKLMLVDELRNNGNNYQLNLNISNFGRGVYLVVVNTNNEKYYSKFVKH